MKVNRLRKLKVKQVSISFELVPKLGCACNRNCKNREIITHQRVLGLLVGLFTKLRIRELGVGYRGY